MKLPNEAQRITRNPELFIYEITSKKSNQYWRLVDVNNKSMGIFTSEKDAKDAAVRIALRFMKSSKDYQELYEAKLKWAKQLADESQRGLFAGSDYDQEKHEQDYGDDSND